MLKVRLYGYQVWYHSLAFAEELKKSKSVKIISVFDEDPKQAKRLGEAAAKHKELKIYTDPDEFAKSGIDFAILTCLPSRRIEAVKKLASRKKHLLIDKPISSTSAGALEIIKICKSENVKLMVGYNLHWSKSLKFAKEVLDEGSLGKPLYGFFAYDGPMLQEFRMEQKSRVAHG